MLSVSSSSNVAPAPDSLVTMLIQALNAEDHALLEEVLHYRKPATVEKTLTRLPITHVVQLINVITEKIETRPSRGSEMVIWLKLIFRIHRSYLLSTPDIALRLQPLYRLIDTQLHNYTKLNKLQGKLELLLQEKKSEDDISPIQESESESEDDVLESDDSTKLSE